MSNLARNKLRCNCREDFKPSEQCKQPGHIDEINPLALTLSLKRWKGISCFILSRKAENRSVTQESPTRQLFLNVERILNLR